MLSCYICHNDQSPTADHLRVHIRQHESCGEGSLPYFCHQNGCLNAYSLLQNLIKHIRKHHVILTEHKSCENLFPRASSLDMTSSSVRDDPMNIDFESCSTTEAFQPKLGDLTNECAQLAAELLQTIESISI